MHIHIELSRTMTVPIILLFIFVPDDGTASSVQSVPATVEIMKTINVSLINEMNLGKIVVSDESGIVVLDPASNLRTCDSSVQCAGIHARALLKLTGSDANVRINFSPSFLLNGPGQDILAEPILPGGADPMINMASGEAKVYLGARIYINARQTPGIYSGTFAVNVEYN